jgi:hypothetical protein
MLMTTREKRPATRTLRGWAIAVLREAGAIRNARSTAGCRTAPIRTLASAPSTSREMNDCPEFRRKRQRSPSPRCWIRSATAAPNARRPRRRARDIFFSDKPLFDFLTEVPTFLTAFSPKRPNARSSWLHSQLRTPPATTPFEWRRSNAIRAGERCGTRARCGTIRRRVGYPRSCIPRSESRARLNVDVSVAISGLRSSQ